MKRLLLRCLWSIPVLLVATAGTCDRQLRPATTTQPPHEPSIDTSAHDSLPPSYASRVVLPEGAVEGQRELWRRSPFEKIDESLWHAARKRVGASDERQLDAPSGRYRLDGGPHNLVVWEQVDSSDYRPISLSKYTRNDYRAFWEHDTLYLARYLNTDYREEGHVIDNGTEPWRWRYERFTPRHDPGALLQTIDSTAYAAAREQLHPPKPLERRWITDFDEVKRLLAGRAFFGKRFSDDKTEADLTKIVLPDGKQIPTFGMGWYPDESYCAYYPDEEVLVLAGNEVSGTLCSIDLRTGEQTDVVGFPDFWLPSPSGRYRFNGYWNGATLVDVFFVQERIDGRYRSLHESIDDYETFNAIEELFWDGDSVLYFRRGGRRVLAVFGDISESADGPHEHWGCYRLVLR